MISHSEAQELHQRLGGLIQTFEDAGMVDKGDALPDLERARELAAVIVSDTEPEEPDTNEYPTAYHWLGWESEADFEPGRADTYFLTICHPDGEEMAVIIHRTVDGEFPLDGIVAKSKEADAQRIVDALNRS